MSSFGDIRSGLLKKYNVSAAGVTGSTKDMEDKEKTEFQSIREKLRSKYSTERTEERTKAVSSWADRYNSVTKGVSDYQTKLNGGYTKDASGGYSADIDSLIKDYDSIKDYADRLGLPNSQRYLEQLQELQGGIQKTNDYMSQFLDEADYNHQASRDSRREAMLQYDVAGNEAASKKLKSAMDEAVGLREQLKQNQSDPLTMLTQKKTVDALQKRLDDITGQYGSVDEMKFKQSQYQQDIYDARRVQEGQRLVTDARADKDFDTLGTVDTGNADAKYRYINDADYRREYDRMVGSEAVNNFAEAGLELMTGEEKQLYNYYWAKGGAESAETYLDSIREELNSRKARTIYEDLSGDEWLDTAMKFAYGGEAGIDQWQSGARGGIDMVTGKDSFVPATAKQMASSMVREDLKDTGPKLPDWMGGTSLGQMAYDAVTTTANMAPSILASTLANVVAPGSGQIVGNVMIGGSALGGAYQEALNQGYDKGQAGLYASMIGASEVGLNALLGGISKLGGVVTNGALEPMLSKVDNAILRTAGRIGGNMLSEGLEESLQEVMSTWFSNIALGKSDQVSWDQVLYSGLLGTLTAGVFEGTDVVSDEVGTYRQGQELKAQGVTGGQLAEVGKTFDIGSKARELAERVDNNTDAYTMGRLFQEVGAGLSEQNKADIARNLMEKGMSEEIAVKHAQIMEHIVEGGEVSNLQMKMIQKNDVLAETMREVIYNEDSGLNQRNQAYKDLLTGRDTVVPAAQTAENSAVTEMEEKLPTEENADYEGEYGAREDGKTYLKSTGKAVEPGKVTAIRDGKVTMETKDGKTVHADDVEFGDQGYDLVFRSVTSAENMTPAAANTIMQVYEKTDKDISAGVYGMGATQVFRQGYYGIKNTGAGLSAMQAEMIYNAGRQAAVENARAAQAAVAKNAATGSNAAGKVHFAGDITALTERQRTSISTLEKVAEAMGVQIHVFESQTDEKGHRIGANGWYDPSDSSIHIDLHAGANGEGTMLFTASHELTHHIKQWSPEKFKTLSDFLMTEYGSRDVGVESLVANQIEKARKNGREISYDTAFEEVVADSMETMLADGSVVEKLAKLKQQDRSLWQKVKDFIGELAAKIRSVYEGLTPDSAEGRYVTEMKDSIERLQDLFVEGLADASGNYQAAGAQKNTAGDGGEIKYSLRVFEDGQRFVDVQMDPHVFDGMTVAEMNRAAKNILMEKFAGRVIGIENRVFVNGDSINEYLHPSKSIDLDTRRAKLTASGELDNLLDAGIALPNEADGKDGHIHPDAIDFSYYRTIFKVGAEYFEGIVNVKNIKRGKLLKDVTKIKNITEDIVSSYGQNPKSNFLRDASMNSIRSTEENVNRKFSDRDGSNSAAVSHFGKTFNWNETGYLLTSGTRLDFSGRHEGALGGYRSVDHRDILDIYPEDTTLDGNGAMIDFMSRGNIRIMPECNGINLQIAPTKAQEQSLDYFISKVRGEVILDIDDTKGNTVVSVEYPRGTRSTKVIQDIRNYFLDGTKPMVSELSRFRYSNRDKIASVSNRTLLVNALEGAAQTQEERQKLAEYRKRIETVEDAQKRLDVLNRKIREASFAPGKRDTAKIAEMRKHAKGLAETINGIDKKLLGLEASAPLKAVLEREKKKAYQRAEQKGRDALQAYREKEQAKQKQITERYQESRAKGIESRKRTAMRHKVQGVVKELNQYLLKGNKDKHVPIGLQKAVAEALSAVNMDTVGADERVAVLNEKIARVKDPDIREALIQTRDRIQSQGDRMADKLKALRDSYNEFIKSDDPLIANSHDDVIAAKLESVIETVGDTPLRDMTVKQLEDVYDMYKMVLTSVRNANKAFKAAKGETIAQMGSGVMEEVERVGGKRQYGLAFMEGVRKFGWNNLKPVYAFQHIGSETLAKLFDNVRAGEDVWARDVVDARAVYLEKAKKYGYNDWDMDQYRTFESASGMEFSLNLPQIMSLYAYSKREQAAEHLRRGGIVIDESTEVTMKTKLGFKVKFNPTEATAYNISDDTLAEIVSKLTPEQKGFVDEMQDYLSTTMGEKGNEVSLQMYGVKLFKEKNYFPLKSATQYMAKAKEQQKGEVKIKNSGFSKETVKKANNPVVLTPFMEVWAEHVNDMSMYHAFVLPLEDFYRVYNFKTATSEAAETQSVESIIQNAYGKGATGYIDQLLKDLNGGARADATTGVITKGMNLFKKGAVFASASVVIQQPSAIARATTLIDTKYFVGRKVDKQRHAELWEEIKQYAPVAIIKEMGYFDTNMGKSTQDFLLGKEYEGIGEKMKALVADGNYRDEVLSKAPALADELAWCAIWEACQREVIEKHPGMLRRDREGFKKLVGERFTEVIVKTQVYDSVLSRSANMRSKDTGMKMATAFMAEPTTSINMVADALLQAKRGKGRYARKAIGSVVAAQILNSVLVSFVYAARDDDEDETYAEKYLGSLVSEVVDGMNPATYVPFVKDIVSIVQGYEVERSDMSVISDLWNAWQKLDSETVSTWKKVEGFAGSIAQIFGIPVKNIMRDLRSVQQMIEGFRSGQRTTKAGIGYVINEALFGETVSKQDQLYNAMLGNDKVQLERVKARYEDEDAVKSAMRSAIRERYIGGEISAMEASKYLVKHCGLDGSETRWALDEWDYVIENGSTENYSKYNRFYEAVESGENLTAVIEDYTSNGVAEKTLSGQITAHFKDTYLDMSATERGKLRKQIEKALLECGVEQDDVNYRMDCWDFEAEYGFSYDERETAYKDGKLTHDQLKEALMTISGKAEEDAELQIQIYDWEKEVPGCEGITAAAIQDYNESCADAGVPKQAYYDAWKFKNNTEPDYDAEGNSVAYSTVKKVLPYIGSLDLTEEQKDALALTWWAAKTVRKYKTW